MNSWWHVYFIIQFLFFRPVVYYLNFLSKLDFIFIVEGKNMAILWGQRA